MTPLSASAGVAHSKAIKAVASHVRRFTARFLSWRSRFCGPLRSTSLAPITHFSLVFFRESLNNHGHSHPSTMPNGCRLCDLIHFEWANTRSPARTNDTSAFGFFPYSKGENKRKGYTGNSGKFTGVNT